MYKLEISWEIQAETSVHMYPINITKWCNYKLALIAAEILSGKGNCKITQLTSRLYRETKTGTEITKDRSQQQILNINEP